MVALTNRVSHIDAGIDRMTIALLAGLRRVHATSVSFHANRLMTLDVHVTSQYRSKNEDEEALRHGARLEEISELDLSSNCLHKGTVARGVPRGVAVNLLGICPRLRRLNVASNGLTERSFAVLAGSHVLARLDGLDLSHNRFAELPRTLPVICPALKHLSATNNAIGSLSSLLQVLRQYRGKLESLKLTNNAVCSKELYYEKVLFVCGGLLVRLDGGKVQPGDREKARRKLTAGGASPSSQSSKRLQPTTTRKQIDADHARGWGHREGEPPDAGARSSVVEDAADEKIKALEEQVILLSASVETRMASEANDSRPQKEARDTKKNGDSEFCTQLRTDTVLKDTHTRHQNRKTSTVDESSKLQALKACNANMSRRQKTAAIFLFKTILGRKRRARSKLHLAFLLWTAVARFVRHAQKATAKHLNLDKEWQAKATGLAEKAVKEERERGKRRQDDLADEVSDLDERLKREQRRRRNVEEESQRNARALEARFTADIERHQERARQAQTEVERLRKELTEHVQALDMERSGQSEHTKQTNELFAAHTAQMHELKLDIVKKDVSAAFPSTSLQISCRLLMYLHVLYPQATIQRLKDLYEQAANNLAKKAVADKSRLTQALDAKQQATESLYRQTDNVRRMQSEMERIVASHERDKSAWRSKSQAKASILSKLSGEMEERGRAIVAAEGRIKSLLVERDEKQKHLLECNKEKSCVEERCNHLQTQINFANGNHRRSLPILSGLFVFTKLHSSKKN